MQLVGVLRGRELWAASAIILIGAFIVSPGFFSIDEAIYYLGARAIAEWGSLSITNNGFDQFHSEALQLRLLVNGPQGLTSQYPAGSALVTAPLLPFLGPRAFILLNALAAIGTLFTVRKICLDQFKSETIAWISVALLTLGTFWLEYAAGIWPHMLAAYFAVQAYWFALRHLGADGSGNRDAIYSGLFAGAGMLFRLDAALAVPAIGLIMIAFAPRYVRSSIWFGLAVLPSVALAAWLNYLKFGSANPFSYGKTGGNTDLAAYGPLLAALCIAFGGLILWRKVGWRIDRNVAIASIIALGGALLVIPATNAWALRFWNGFLALIIDVRNVEDYRTGIQAGPGGTRLFWELPKKSLGQSMPWIGLLAMLLTSGVQNGQRGVIGSLLLFIATMTMPFILLSWHGGSGGNMRYFLPVLPALSILCAKIVSDLWPSVPKANFFAVGGVWAAIALSVAWVFLHPSGFAGVHQILSTYFLVATALVAVAAGISWRFRQVARKLAVALVGGGFFIAMTCAVSDFKRAAVWRAKAHDVSESIAGLPARSLVITFPEWAVVRIPGDGSILATRDAQTKRNDPQLILNALDAGYRVYMTDFEFDPRRSVPPDVEILPTNHSYPGGRWIELRRRPADARDVG